MRTFAAVKSFLSILKRLDRRLHVLALHPEPTLRLLFQSMTSVQRRVAIGYLRRLNDSVGSLYVACLRINQSPRSSRMDFTTSPSSGELTAYVHFEPSKTLCYSTTRSSRRASKA